MTPAAYARRQMAVRKMNVTEEPITPGLVARQSRIFRQAVRELQVPAINGCPDGKRHFDTHCPCQGHLNSPCVAANRKGD